MHGENMKLIWVRLLQERSRRWTVAGDNGNTE